jgi:hypothetical protein
MARVGCHNRGAAAILGSDRGQTGVRPRFDPTGTGFDNMVHN